MFQDAARSVLGVCFRLLGAARNSDSVLNTAAATVRQVVALVFAAVSSTRSESATHSPLEEEAIPPVDNKLDTADAPQPVGAHAAALNLVTDLCAMVTGVVTVRHPAASLLSTLQHVQQQVAVAGGELVWLRSPLLARPFVLEMLDFVLNSSSDVFKVLPDFQDALLSKVRYFPMTPSEIYAAGSSSREEIYHASRFAQWSWDACGCCWTLALTAASNQMI